MKGGTAGGAMLDGTVATMTAPQVEAAAARGAGVLLPVGVIEAHGPHLPTGTDAMLATQLCAVIRRHAARELLVAPPFFWGVNGILGRFAGSFDIRPETARMLLDDVFASLTGQGFRDVFVVSHHGDMAHNRVVLAAVEAAQAAGHAGVRWLYAPNRPAMAARLGMTGNEPVWVPWTPPVGLGRFRLTGVLGVHADEFETAAMVRYFPDTVDHDALRGLPPTALGPDDLAEWRTGDAAARRLTPHGYFGAPNPVDPELWRFFDETARSMAAALPPPR